MQNHTVFTGFVVTFVFFSFSYTRTYDNLLWAMLGSDEREESEIKDTRYAYIKKWEEAYIVMFIVAAFIVAFNMLVATMNHTYENIMVSIYKSFEVFPRAKQTVLTYM